MAYEIEAAIITTGGAIAAAILTVYLPQWQAKKKAESSGLANIVEGGALGQAVTLPDVPTDRGNFSKEIAPRFSSFIDSRPFDSNITYDLRDGALLFRIPGSRTNLFQILFMSGWLAGWTAGIFFVTTILLSSLFNRGAEQSGLGWFGGVFMSGWLVAAIAGEYAAIQGLTSILVVSLGNQYIAALRDRMIVRKSLLFMKIDNVYASRYLRNWKATQEGLQFEYGKQKELIGGPTEIEASWIASGLIAQYDQA